MGEKASEQKCSLVGILVGAVGTCPAVWWPEAGLRFFPLLRFPLEGLMDCGVG